jgi:coenzyme F420-reducing hydrogenase gamma subunit
MKQKKYRSFKSTGALTRRDFILSSGCIVRFTCNAHCPAIAVGAAEFGAAIADHFATMELNVLHPQWRSHYGMKSATTRVRFIWTEREQG